MNLHIEVPLDLEPMTFESQFVLWSILAVLYKETLNRHDRN